MEFPLDYATLRVIWWGLMGVLLIGFALTDGFEQVSVTGSLRTLRRPRPKPVE